MSDLTTRFQRTLFDKVLVQRCDGGETTPGGIIIPDSAKQPSAECLVHRVGPDVREVKVGDRVLIDNVGQGLHIKLDGIPLIVLRENAILAVCEED